MKNLFFKMEDGTVTAWRQLKVADSQYVPDCISSDVCEISDADLFIIGADKGYKDFYKELGCIRRKEYGFEISSNKFELGGLIETMKNVNDYVCVSPFAYNVNIELCGSTSVDLRNSLKKKLYVKGLSDGRAVINLYTYQQSSVYAELTEGVCLETYEEQINSMAKFDVVCTDFACASIRELNNNRRVNLKGSFFASKLRVDTGYGRFNLLNLDSVSSGICTNFILNCVGYDNLIRWLDSAAHSDRWLKLNIFDENMNFANELISHFTKYEGGMEEESKVFTLRCGSDSSALFNDSFKNACIVGIRNVFCFEYNIGIDCIAYRIIKD